MSKLPPSKDTLVQKVFIVWIFGEEFRVTASRRSKAIFMAADLYLEEHPKSWPRQVLVLSAKTRQVPFDYMAGGTR